VPRWHGGSGPGIQATVWGLTEHGWGVYDNDTTLSLITQQKSALRSVLKDAGRPLSAQEVFRAARRRVRGLGIATVYRNLKTLVREGWLVIVSLPGESARYEVSGKGHHHHFHCKDCNRVFEVPVCAPDVAQMTPSGFVLDGHDVVLYGICKECAE
jgi:Fur family ferric uptake transcriptional regulator